MFDVTRVSLEAYQGSGAHGDTFAAAVDVPCYVEGVRKLVRDQSGAEVVSETTIHVQDLSVAFPPGSKVTRGTVTSTVITTSTFDDGSDLAHLEVAIT